MCKYTYKDFETAASRLEKSNAGDARTVRRFLKDFKGNSRDGARVATIVNLCKGVLPKHVPS